MITKMANTSKKASRSKETLEASLVTLDVWLIVFGILVAIGVTGESIVGFLHWRESNRLQSINDTEVARLNSVAESAQRDAAIANEKAEHERLERMKIQSRLAPRRLTREEQKRIALTIAPFGPIRISIFEPKTEPEIREFAYDIARALREAEWRVSLSMKADAGRVIVGVIIELTTDDRHIEKAAESLAGALKHEGVFTQGPMAREHWWQYSFEGDIDDVKAPIHIIVGSKPDFP